MRADVAGGSLGGQAFMVGNHNHNDNDDDEKDDHNIEYDDDNGISRCVRGNVSVSHTF